MYLLQVGVVPILSCMESIELPELFNDWGGRDVTILSPFWEGTTPK